MVFLKQMFVTFRKDSKWVLKFSCTQLGLEKAEQKVLASFLFLERVVLFPALILSSSFLLLALSFWGCLKAWSYFAGGGIS